MNNRQKNDKRVPQIKHKNGAVPTPKDCANHCLLNASKEKSKEDFFLLPQTPLREKPLERMILI